MTAGVWDAQSCGAVPDASVGIGVLGFEDDGVLAAQIGHLLSGRAQSKRDHVVGGEFGLWTSSGGAAGAAAGERAVLSDLILRGRIDIAGQGESVKAGRLAVRSTAQIGDELLDIALQKLIDQPGTGPKRTMASAPARALMATAVSSATSRSLSGSRSSALVARTGAPPRFAKQVRLCLVLDLPQIGDTWHTCPVDATVVMGRQGRLVIPAEVRAALGLVPGDRLHLHVAGPRLVLERQQDAVAELRALAGDVPKSRSFVEELLAERRLAADAE